jgi:type IV pilus assembly protein PilX
MNHLSTRSRQRGAVLIVSLMFLVILTMLGVTAMTGTTMEERMAGNTRDAAIAHQAAEAALRDARRDISNLPIRAGFARTVRLQIDDFYNNLAAGQCDNTGICLPTDIEHSKLPPAVLPVTPKTHNLKGSPSVAYGTYTGAPPLGATSETASVLSAQPRYLIEGFCLMDPGESIREPLCNFFRITARGYGRNPNTVVTLQEVFLSL